MLTKEYLLSGALVDHLPLWHPHHFHDATQLLLLILSRKNRETGVHLGENATKTPHVDGHVIAATEDDLW